MDRGYVDQPGSSSAQTRSYTCSFCKRGFSNAQALGGHMNIHRKDRAKLRQSLEEDGDDEISISLQIKNTNPTKKQRLRVSDDSFSSFSESSEEQSCVTTKPVSLKVDESETLVEIPFFVVEDSVKTDDVLVCVSEEKKVTLAEGPSIKVLDLELRLGLDPCVFNRR